MRRISAVIMVAVLVVVAGCTGGNSGSSDTGDDAPSGDTNVSQPVSVTPDATPDWTVALSNYAFSREELTIPAGTVVRFQNTRGQHTVTITAGGVDRILQEGDGLTLTFNEQGTFQVYCRFHGSPGSGMHSDVIVG